MIERRAARAHVRGQFHRSAGAPTTEGQRREPGEAVKELKRHTGAPWIALVGNSRGGYSIRNYIRNGGGASRPVVALFNRERIVSRTWPVSENRIAVAELTH